MSDSLSGGFACDLNGNLTSWTDRKGQVTTYTYDALDRLTFIGYGTTGTPATYASTVTLTYDDGNRVTHIVDSGAGTISRTFDLLDRLTQEVTPEGTVSYTYDGDDRRATMTITDARGKTTTWTYNTMDRVATRTDPLSRQESFTYDLHGNLTSWTDRKGQVTTYTYDALDRLTFIGYGTTGAPPTYQSTVTLTYDDGIASRRSWTPGPARLPGPSTFSID